MKNKINSNKYDLMTYKLQIFEYLIEHGSFTGSSYEFAKTINGDKKRAWLYKKSFEEMGNEKSIKKEGNTYKIDYENYPELKNNSTAQKIIEINSDIIPLIYHKTKMTFLEAIKKLEFIGKRTIEELPKNDETAKEKIEQLKLIATILKEIGVPTHSVNKVVKQTEAKSNKTNSI